MNSTTRYLLILLLLTLASSEAFSQDTTTDKFAKGVTFFNAGSYKEALQVWTDIYNTGYRSASLDYNIGNAFFKLKDASDRSALTLIVS